MNRKREILTSGVCRRTIVILLAGAFALGGPSVFGGPFVLAGDHKHGAKHDHKHDHDEAREALIRGEIAPLEKVLATIHSEVKGDFIGAELEVEDGIWVYDFKFIDRQGVLRKIHVDAKSGKILSRDSF